MNFSTLTPQARIEMMFELSERKADLDAKLDDVKSRIADLEALIQLDFAKHGYTNVKTARGTIYAATEWWPKQQVAADTLVSVLAAHDDTKHLVKEGVNSQSLRSFLLEGRDENGGEPVIPPHLQGYVTMEPKHRIKIRK